MWHERHRARMKKKTTAFIMYTSWSDVARVGGRWNEVKGLMRTNMNMALRLMLCVYERTSSSKQKCALAHSCFCAFANVCPCLSVCTWRCIVFAWMPFCYSFWRRWWLCAYSVFSHFVIVTKFCVLLFVSSAVSVRLLLLLATEAQSFLALAVYFRGHIIE